jgi:hypothetical protein
MFEHADEPDDCTAKKDASEDQGCKIDTRNLGLPGNSTLLEFNRLLCEAAILRQLIALNVANFRQELGHIIGHTHLGGITDDNLWRPTRRAEEHYTKDKLSTRRGAVDSIGRVMRPAAPRRLRPGDWLWCQWHRDTAVTQPPRTRRDAEYDVYPGPGQGRVGDEDLLRLGSVRRCHRDALRIDRSFDASTG